MKKIFKKEYFGIMALSAAMLLFEMLLVRIFSVVFPNNFTFFAITVTLFGVAIGGLLVFIFHNHFNQNNYQKRVIQYSLLTAVSLVLFLLTFFRINFLNIQPVSFILAVVFSATPFILGNITLVLYFQNRSEKIKILYFSDLIGAGLGVIISLILMQFIGPVNGLFFCIMLTITATLIFSNKKSKYFKPSLIFILIVAIGLVANLNLDSVKISSTKLGDEDEHVIFKKWNTFSRITAYDDGNLFYANLPNPPEIYRILIDSDAATETINFNGDFDDINFLQKDITSAVYQVSQPGTSLIIGPGGGRDVLTALSLGFNVKGVEINPIIANDLVKGKFKEFSGNLYNRDDVELIVAEGRSYLEKDKNKYQVIHIPLVDTWASTSAGNLTLAESYLYTVEAFEQYLNHLENDGILSFTRWELDGMRLLSLFFTASEKLGINDYEKNLAIISFNEGEPGQLNNYLFKTSPFTAEEKEALKKFGQKNDFSIIFMPGENKDNNYNEYVNTNNRTKFITESEKNLKPVYDDDPFFFFAVPILNMTGTNTGHYSGTFLMVFISTFIVALFIIILPLFISKDQKKERKDSSLMKSFALIIYFSCLGLGFLMLEMALIQKFILYLEKPIYSYSVVLVSLLISAGVGSFLSKKISCRRRINFLYISLTIVALVLVAYFVFEPLVSTTINLDIFWKIIISALINAPIGFFMGMMLPMGIKRLEQMNRKDLIPWAWASNGAMSVFASVLAMFLAILLGLKTVMLISAALYLLAPLMIFLSYNLPNKISLPNQNPESTPHQ